MSVEAGVTESNTPQERLIAARGRRMSWREIQHQFAEFAPIPVRTLWKIATTGEVPHKWREHFGLPALAPVPVCPDHGGVDCLKCGGAHAGKPKPSRPRPRLVAQVTEDEKAAVRDAARAAGMTEAQYIRVKMGLDAPQDRLTMCAECYEAHNVSHIG